MPVHRYSALPSLTLEDFRQMAKRPGWAPVGRLPTQDLEGIGVKLAEAEDLFVAGFWPEDLYQIERRSGMAFEVLRKGDKQVAEHMKRLGLR